MTLIFPVVRPMRHPLTGGARGAPLPSRWRSDATPMAPGRDSGPVLLLVSTPCAAHFAAIGHDRRGGLSSGARRRITIRGCIPEFAQRHHLEHGAGRRSGEHTSELQSLMRISYSVFSLKKKKH